MVHSQRSTFPHFLRATLPLLGLVISLVVATGSNAESRDGVVHFKSPHRSLVVVGVRVNGMGPYPFLLDTGATSSSVDPGLSTSLHLPSARRARLASWGDTVDARRVAVANLSLGPIDSGPLSVLVLSLSELKSVAPDVRGVLGEDVLLRTGFLIDNRKHRIQFDDDRHLLLLDLQGDRIPTTFVKTKTDGTETRLLSVPVETDLTRSPLQLLLDSGADMAVVRADALLPSTRPRGGKWIADENGKFSPASAFSAKLTVGKSAFSSDVWIGGRGLSHLDIDGLLPTGAFEQLYIGDNGSFVIFEPRRSKAKKRHALAN